MDELSVKAYSKHQFNDYPNIKDLYCLNPRVNGDKIFQQITQLQNKHQKNIAWVKYNITLTDYLNENLRSEALAASMTKVLTFTYPIIILREKKRKISI